MIEDLDLFELLFFAEFLHNGLFIIIYYLSPMNRYTVHNNNNNLIINADDFGFNLHIDQGIY